MGLRLFQGVAGAVGACLVLSLCGCGGGGRSGLNSNPLTSSRLVGTFQTAGLSVGDVSVTCPNNLNVSGVQVSTCTQGEKFTLASDGTYTLTYPAARFGRAYTETGTYTVKDDTLTLTRLNTGTDTNNDGSVTINELNALAASQRLVANIAFAGDGSFTLTPIPSASSSDYTVATTENGSVVTITYAPDAPSGS